MNQTMSKTVITAEPGKQDLFITREFDFPRELVFRAFTDPDLLVQWMGPRGLSMTLQEFEPHSGGRWRYTHTTPDGQSYGFHGVFHEITAPVRMIQTFEFDGMPEPGHVVLDSQYLEELPGGRTRLVAQSVYLSVEDRDGMIQSGMEHGVVEGYERLEEVLGKL